jgi:hypothetical protein
MTIHLPKGSGQNLAYTGRPASLNDERVNEEWLTAAARKGSLGESFFNACEKLPSEERRKC